MDILDRLLAHDTWTTRRLLLACKQLPDQLFDKEFLSAAIGAVLLLIDSIRRSRQQIELIERHLWEAWGG